MFENCQEFGIEGKFWPLDRDFLAVCRRGRVGLKPQETSRRKKSLFRKEQPFRWLLPLLLRLPKFPLDSQKLAKIGLEPCAGRFGQPPHWSWLPNVRIEHDACIGCGKCRKACLCDPAILDDAISGKAAAVDAAGDCMLCGKCLDACPTSVLKVGIGRK